MNPENPSESATPSVLLVCQASPEIGLGHLSRMLVLARTMLGESLLSPHVLIVGEPLKRDALNKLSHAFLPATADFSSAVVQQVDLHACSVVVFDLHPKLIPGDMAELLSMLRSRNVRTVGVDSLLGLCAELDLVWVPTFCLPDDKKPVQCQNVEFGWKTFLLRQPLPHGDWEPGSRVLVLTGGGDTAQQGETLSTLLDAALGAGTDVHWVRGPFALAPRLPLAPRLQWTVHHAPQGLDHLMLQCNYAIAIFGVSFFELLQYGVPTVVYSPYGGKDDFELEALQMEQVACVASDANDAARQLADLMRDNGMARDFSSRSKHLLSANGGQALVSRILELSRS